MTEGIQATLEQALEQADSDDTNDDLSKDLLLEAVGAYFEDTDDMDEQVETLNALRETLHDVSPFSEPVEHIKWVKQESVEGNDYNPNEVATPEMDLLHKSIKEDGYTQPIVTYETDDGEFEVVDGYHRMLIGKTRDDIRERLHNHVPVTVIDKALEERKSSTIRHNRARGTHQIQDMSSLVVDLYDSGWDDEKIGDELGMEQDEVLKLKQSSGLKKAFGDHEFSQSWTEYDDRHGGNDDE